ncbi:HAD family phosphatase [Corynebacterium sp. sy039]|uniref:HAD family hydrolase n=1 Tax=Corynebacterium sp. sy039 TaxID=2599641 RepID=UPI0011B74DD2|nr:HAD family phosphatase [Corynebacterium sp. sy039]QDZ42613.1 HAD family phosphatase [Corynebacterium sp. sy039]
MIMLKAIMWDMDGTLIDSEYLWEQALIELSENKGKRITSDHLRQTRGGNVNFSFDVISRYIGLDPETIDRQQWREELYAQVIALMNEHLEIRPGVTELLKDLRSAGIPMALVTNTERAVATTAMQILGDEYFDFVICGDEVESPKPAPDIYLKAAELLGFAVEECLIFEDSFTGMTAAIESGAHVIGLPEHCDDPLPQGVYPMRELCGSISFESVDAALVQQWFARISLNSVL